MIAIGQRVRVHLNLHRGDFSVGNPSTGLILDNVATITLRDVEFRVQPAMLERIRLLKRRKVCAYAVGYIASFEPQPELTDRITFNPFRASTFECCGRPIFNADLVAFADRYAFTVNKEDAMGTR